MIWITPTSRLGIDAFLSKLHYSIVPVVSDSLTIETSRRYIDLFAGLIKMPVTYVGVGLEEMTEKHVHDQVRQAI